LHEQNNLKIKIKAMMLTKTKYLQKNWGKLDRIFPFGDVTYMSHWALMVKKIKKFLKL